MRTMGIAKKQINEAGLKAFSEQLKAGRQLSDDSARIDAIHLLYTKIESNFHVVGGTGMVVNPNRCLIMWTSISNDYRLILYDFKDHLQEHVEETLEILSDAGIRLWILTGDKVSTAVQAAISCDFIKHGWKLFYATDHPDDEIVEKTWMNIE